MLGKPTQLKSIHEGKILQFLELPQHNMILISSLDKKFVIWDIDTLEPKYQMPVKNSIHSICYSAQLDVSFRYLFLIKNVFCASYTPNIEMWTINYSFMLTPLMEITGHQSTITAIAVMEDMNYLISADDYRVIKCW